MDNFFWFSVYIAINAFLLLLLTFNVSRIRLKYKISVGDNGNKELIYAIRTHANGLEQVLIFAFVILALSFANSSNTVLSILVISFSIARFSHAFGMLKKSFPARRIGAGLTYLLQLIAIIVLAIEIII
jgi:uncharacterized membrane protein YecN with MAPEG domain